MAAIYKITNTVNNKIYIGQTIGDIKKRFKKHLSQVNCKNVCSALYAAFNKYGKDNFYIESLIVGDYSKDELNELEIFYIKKYNSLSPNGYNLQSGGNSFIVIESVKIQTSKKLKGREIRWKNKISESVKLLWKNSEYREKQTLQRHEKRGKYRDGIKKDKLRVNIDIDSFIIDYLNYITIVDLCEKYKISSATIYRLIKEKKIKKRGYKCNKTE
jgi:group I intron endonuclease